MAHIQMERSGEMEVFVRVVREGAFSAAARSLDLTPSAVSKLIARLEERLGVRLLVRTTRALQLTDEGESYFQAAQKIIQELNDAEQAAVGGNLRGRLRINASIPFGRMYVAPLIPPFLKLHPEVLIDFSLTDDMIDLVANRADIAIRTGPLPDSGLVAKKLAAGRKVVCASPAYLKRRGTPKVPADLAQHECLTLNFRSAKTGWPFREKGRDLEQPVTGSLQLNNGETLREMALAGVGIARVGLFHVAKDLKAGRLVSLLERYNPGDIQTISAVYVGGGHVPHRVRAFLDYMVEHIDFTT